MVFKLLEEMRQLRINANYLDYRTVTDIALMNISRDYLYSNELQINEIIKIMHWLESEIFNNEEILDSSLKNKDYKTLKIVSQTNDNIKRRFIDIKEIIYRNDIKYISKFSQYKK